MTTTDKLTDETLKAVARLNPLPDNIAGSMARELLAHRRASQAAPAPSDHLVSVGKASGMVEARVSLAARQIRQTLRDYGHRCAETSLPDLIAADVDAALRKQDELHAPARQDDACPCCGGTGSYGDACVRAINGAAPAPSDALREENERLRGELDWIGNHMVMSMALNESDLIRAMKSRARAALSTPTEERQ